MPPDDRQAVLQRSVQSRHAPPTRDAARTFTNMLRRTDRQANGLSRSSGINSALEAREPGIVRRLATAPTSQPVSPHEHALPSLPHAVRGGAPRPAQRPTAPRDQALRHLMPAYRPALAAPL